jgi:hypothetical protein
MQLFPCVVVARVAESGSDGHIDGFRKNWAYKKVGSTRFRQFECPLH